MAINIALPSLSFLIGKNYHQNVQGYPVSKVLAEKAAWKFAEENNIDLITVIPTLTIGPSLTQEIPSSVAMGMSLLTGAEQAKFNGLRISKDDTQRLTNFSISILYFAGNDFLINALKGMQFLSGSISITHVEDICRAHIFVAEKESTSGRYICCAHNTSVPELAKFLSKRYPQYKVPTE